MRPGQWFIDLRFGLKAAVCSGGALLLLLAVVAVGLLEVRALRGGVERLGRAEAPALAALVAILDEAGRPGPADEARVTAGLADVRAAGAAVDPSALVRLELAWGALAEARRRDPAGEHGRERATVAAAARVIATGLAADTRRLAADAAAGADRGRLRLLVLGAVAAAVALGMGALLARTLGGRFEGLGLLAERIAGGDLTSRVRAGSRDEVGWLEHSFRVMTDQLTTLLRPLQQAAGEVAAASRQIAAATEQLASGAESQARQTTDAATSIEELAQSVHVVYETSQKSQGVSERASATARRGAESVKATLAGMSTVEEAVGAGAGTIAGLETRSEEIGQIVEVIKDIAAQTNLLALNAAIEAARAGEHGRGFEVVAEEIRKLAEKSAESTVKIKELIREIQGDTRKAAAAMSTVVKEVAAGSRLAGQTGEALDELLAAVEETARTIGVVAASSHEQATVSDRVAASVGTISAVTKEAAAASEEIARTAHGLEDLSSRLASLAGRFRLPVQGADPA